MLSHINSMRDYLKVPTQVALTGSILFSWEAAACHVTRKSTWFNLQSPTAEPSSLQGHNSNKDDSNEK